MPLRELVQVAAILAELEADPAPRAMGKKLGFGDTGRVIRLN
jgi:hypothetical protein